MKKITPKLLTLEGDVDELLLGAWPAIIAKVVKGVGTIVGGIAKRVRERKAEKATEKANQDTINRNEMLRSYNVKQQLNKKKNQQIILLGAAAIGLILLTKKPKKTKK